MSLIDDSSYIELGIKTIKIDNIIDNYNHTELQHVAT